MEILSVVIQRNLVHSVVCHFIRVRCNRNGYIPLRDRQFAGNGRDGIAVGDILAITHYGDLGIIVKGTIRIGVGIGAGGRRIARDRQHIALGKALDGIVDVGDRVAGAGDAAIYRITGLFFAVIGLGPIIDGDRQGRLGHFQGAEFLFDGIVLRVHRILAGAPIDLICVGCFARLGDGTGGGNRDLVCVRVHQAGEARLILGQRRAVILLLATARLYRQLRREYLQTAGTDVQAHAVVRIIRQVRKRKVILEVGIIAGVGLCDAIVFETRRFRIIGRLALNRFPDRIQIGLLVSIMANLDVVCNALARVGEAGLVRFAGVGRVGPAVGLDSDGDVDLRHLQGAADIANGIVCLVPCGTGLGGLLNDRACGRDHGHAGVETARLIALSLPIGIGEINAGELISVQQAIHRDLALQRIRQRQKGAVILLGVAVRSDGDPFLVEEGELEALRRDRFGDLIGAFGFSISIGSAFHRPVQLPPGNGRARKGEGFAHLQLLHGGIRNGITVHVHIVDGDGGALEAGIVEGDDVLIGIRGKDQGLFRSVGIEFDAVQIRIFGTEGSIIHRCSQHDDGGGVAGDIVDRERIMDLDIAGELLGVKDIANGIAGGLRLAGIDKGDDIGRIRVGEGQGLAVGLGTIAGHRDGQLGNHLAHHKVGVGDHLVRGHGIVRLIHIADGIAEGVAGPVGVNGGVRRDLCVPVEQGVPLGGGVPAVEGIAGLGGRGLQGAHLAVLRHVRFGLIHRGGVFTIHIGDGEGGGHPLGIHLHAVSGHGGESIRILQPGVGIPAAPGKVAVHTVRTGGRIVVLRAADVSLEENVCLGGQQRRAIPVFDIVFGTVIIETIGIRECYIISGQILIATFSSFAIKMAFKLIICSIVATNSIIITHIVSIVALGDGGNGVSRTLITAGRSVVLSIAVDFLIGQGRSMDCLP